MLRRSMAIAQAVLFVNLLFASPAPAQTQTAAAQADKTRDKVTRIGLRNEITVRLNNRDVYYGTVEAIENDTFKIYEVDLKQIVLFKFAEVRKVEKGYGHNHNIFGQRVSPRQQHIGAALGIAGAVIVGVILAVGLRND